MDVTQTRPRVILHSPSCTCHVTPSEQKHINCTKTTLPHWNHTFGATQKKTYNHLTSYYQETQKTPNLPAFSNTNHTLETVSSENCTLLLPLHLQGLQRWWNQTLSQVPHAATFVNPMPISAISYRLVQHWTGLYYTQPKIISLFALWLRTSFF